jgi:broad specificity phosphatase PhoE
MNYYEKYIKYKTKYLDLLKENNILQKGGMLSAPSEASHIQPRIIKLFIVRHAKGVHQWGIMDKHDMYVKEEAHNPCYKDATLLQEGKNEALMLREFFTENNLDLIYTSGLKRTIQTMIHALGERQIIDKNIQIFSTDDLNEDSGTPMNCRSQKGELIAYIRTNYYTKNILGNFNFDDIKDSYDEGVICVQKETKENLKQRIMEWFSKMVTYIKSKESIKNIGIFSHGFIIVHGVYEFFNEIFPEFHINIRIARTQEIIPFSEYKSRLEAEGKGLFLNNTDMIILEFDINKL